MSDEEEPPSSRPPRGKTPRRPRSTALRRKRPSPGLPGAALAWFDVGGRRPRRRRAVARGRVRYGPGRFSTLSAAGRLSKGDALAVARLAGILAAKKTAEIVPLAHPIPLESVVVECRLDAKSREVVGRATVSTSARTGSRWKPLTGSQARAWLS